MNRSDIAVLIATKDRPALVRDLVQRLKKQTRSPDHIFVAGAHADDLALLDPSDPDLTFFVGRAGRAACLNDLIAAASDSYSYLVFFDDDFMPSRFWIEQALAVFASTPEAVAVAGEILAGGFDTRGVDPIDAEAIVSLRDGFPVEGPTLNSSHGLLGCNMAARSERIEDVRLDEGLPAGSLLADADFCARIARIGRVGRAPQLAGVKMDVKLLVPNGRQLGRGQMVNAAYLARKGTFSVGFALKFMARAFWANALRAIVPEPYIDRRGRLLGNIEGLFALLNPATLAAAKPGRSPSLAAPGKTGKAMKKTSDRDGGSFTPSRMA